MPEILAEGQLATHMVENQPPGLFGGDLWESDLGLKEAVAAFSGDTGHLAQHSAQLSTPDMRAAGRLANRNLPELVSFDAQGRRLDEVQFHPAYHQLMTAGLEGGYAALPWTGAKGGHVTHAAMVYLHSQIDPGTCCPMTMTYAAVPALSANPDLAAAWVPKLTARAYDPRVLPIDQKHAATLGMAMTEKQGGSDVRANTTRAEQSGDHYILTGHKWFCSAPMSDGFLTLAQAPGGLTCFLVPRWLDDRRNAIRIMRLKDKLGNKSNASSEIEYHGAIAHRLGDEGAGVRTIIEMVHHTRLDTAMAPAGLMRAALTEAIHWSRHRSAFQRKLIDQPLMQTVLADLALDTEAATWLGLRVAHAFDTGDTGLSRIAVALAKFLNNKRCPNVIYEAMEALGGMGYVEDTPLPMLYREAPLNSIWEGSGNVICLDILRTMAREPAAAEALNEVLFAGLGQDDRYDSAYEDMRQRWQGLPPETEARTFAETAANLLAAETLMTHAPTHVAEAYIASRLTPRGTIAGTVAPRNAAAILDRALHA